MRTWILLILIDSCFLLAAGLALCEQHYFLQDDHMRSFAVQENTRRACLEQARSDPHPWWFIGAGKFDCVFVGVPPPLPFLIFQPYRERIGPYNNWQECERQAHAENALADQRKGLYKARCAWRQPDLPDVALYFSSRAACDAQAAAWQKEDASMSPYYVPQCGEVKSEKPRPGGGRFALTFRVKDKETPSFAIEPEGVPDLMSPNWSPFPHLDEMPCDSDSECASGLKCQESKFDISSGEVCSFDYQCLLPAMRFRNRRLQLVGHCWWNHCTYRPAQWRWCLHRRELSDPPIYSERKCEHNFDCPSGQSCSSASAEDPSARCVYLPAIVWPPGTNALPAGIIDSSCVGKGAPSMPGIPSARLGTRMLEAGGRFAGRINIQAANPRVAQPGSPWSSATQLPEDFPRILDIKRGTLPAAPAGYFWIEGSELSRCHYCGALSGGGSHYSATTYLLSEGHPECQGYADEERLNQDLNESMTFSAADFEPPCGSSDSQ